MRRFLPIAVVFAACAPTGASHEVEQTRLREHATVAALRDVAPFLRELRPRQSAVLDVDLPSRGHAPLRIARHDDRGFFVSVAVAGARDVTASNVDGVTLLSEIDRDTDLALATDGQRVEDLTVLRGSASRTLTRILSFGPSVASARVRDGRIELLDASGRVGLATDDIVAVDARGTHAILQPRLDGERLIIEVPRELVAPVTVDPLWTTVSSMKTARMKAVSASLSNGKVLVVGGAPNASSSERLSSAEVYDPVGNTWTAIGNAPGIFDSQASAVAVTGTKVLLVGEVNTVYDATSGSLTAAGSVYSFAPAAVTLDDGRVFVTGGDGTTPPPTRIWSPTAGWSTVANDPIRRYAPSAVKLNDGKVLVAGGRGSDLVVLSTAEIYDPVANTWSSAPSLSVPRAGGVMVRFASGASLLYGGFNGLSNVDKGDVLNPTTRAWTLTADQFGGFYGAAALLPGDRALLAEGFVSYIFDLATATVGTTPPRPAQGAGPIAAAISGGRVLVAGGQTSTGAVTSVAEIFQLGALGESCSSDGNCASGFCALPAPFAPSGVCCTAKCDGPCQTCTATPGTCTAVTGIPRDPFACGVYMCNAGACRASCTDNTHCAPTHFCSAGACVVKKDPGATCAAAGDCKSGFCVDGVCCGSPCTDQCAACDVPGNIGTCVAVRGAPHGARTSCGAGDADCGRRCNGVVTTSCSFPDSTTPCGAYGCTGGVETHVARCNGSGACTDTPKACGAYACDTSACKSICSTATDCAAGYRCVAGACVPREGLGRACDDGSSCTTAGCVDGVCCGVASCAPGSGCAAPGKEGTCTKNRGTTCANDAECGTGICVDGVCCDSRCTGNCEACDVPGHFGTCFPVKGAPHGARPKCKSDPAAPCADEVCDGADVTKCAGFVGPETPCRASSCNAGKALAEATCDGKGACPTATEVSCGGYQCDDAKLACRKTCRADDDCLEGFNCRDEACVPKSATCSKDLLSVIAVDGATTSCAPFVCKGGKCLDACTTSNDCVAGRVCDPGAKTCVEPSPVAAAEEGGCSASRRPASGSFSLAFLALAVVIARRRTRLAVAALAAIGCSSREPPATKPASTHASILEEVRSFGFARSHVRRALDVKLPATANGTTVLRDGDVSMSVTAIDLGAVAPKNGDDTQEFRAAATDVDVVHVVDGDRFEDVRILRSPRASNVARYRVDTSLSRRMRDGHLELVDGTGRVRFVAERPFAVDARGVRRDAELALDGDVVTVTLDPAALQYPIALDPTWTTIAPMGTARYQHRAVTTTGGRVLVVAGRNSTGFGITTAEIYDPVSNTWKATGAMAKSPVSPMLVALSDGRVADINDGELQLYDPTANTWTATTVYPSTRQSPFGVGLADGRLLVAGGVDGVGADLKSALIYDRVANTYTAAGTMNVARPYSAGVALLRQSDGRVLVIGGSTTPSLERFDPTAKTWTSLATPSADAYSAVLLTDGRVLATSIADAQSFLYTPSTNTWSAGPTAPFDAGRLYSLSDGTAWSWNGADKVALFDTTTSTWVRAGDFAPIGFSTYEFSLNPTLNAGMLLAGGQDGSTVYTRALVWRRMSNGNACTFAGECASGQCVDGYCCNTACTAGCSACNLPGSLGTCSPVTGAPVGGRTGCSPYTTCSAGACATSCSSDVQCVGTHWCNGSGVCTAKAANGGACTTARGCVSGNCVDGVCCNTPCGDQCAACNEPGKVGTCSPVTGAPRGTRAACAGFGAGTTCGIRCDGVTTATCTYPTAATSCGANACTDSIETHATSCNGLGKCSDTPKSCGAYACGTTECKTTCSASTDCAKGFYCLGGSCVPAAGLGKPCTAGDTCATGNCVDGVCCATSSCDAGSTCAHPGHKGTCSKSDATTCANDAECGSGSCVDGVCCEARCDGKCQACDVAGQVGRCAPVTGAPHGARGACPSDPSNVCQGSSCDGKDTTKCVALAGPEINCREPSCDKGVATQPASCNGTGTCPAVVTSSCDGYACDPTTKGCRTTCSAPSDCEGGYACRDGKCIAATATCSTDSLSVQSVDGTSQSCAPYLCRDNACLTACASSADCVSGTLCDPTTKTCAPPSAPAEDDGGGCSYGSRASNAFAALLLAVALAALRRRTVS